MNGVAIGMHSRAANGAVFVFDIVRFDSGFCTAAHRFGKRHIGIIDFKRDIANAVAVFLYVLRGGIIRGHRRRQNKIRLALTQNIGSLLTLPRFQSAIGGLREAETLAVIIGRLPGVADPEFDMMNAPELERIFHSLYSLY